MTFYQDPGQRIGFTAWLAGYYPLLGDLPDATKEEHETRDRLAS